MNRRMAATIGVMATMCAGAVTAQAPPAQPSAATMALARRVAAHEDMMAVVAMIGQSQIAEIERGLGKLTPAEKAKADAIGKAKLAEGVSRITDRLAVIYAGAFRPADLAAMAAFLESPAGVAYSGRLPPALPALGEAMKGFDFKSEILAQTCAQIGKGCPASAAPTPPVKPTPPRAPGPLDRE